MLQPLPRGAALLALSALAGACSTSPGPVVPADSGTDVTTTPDVTVTPDATQDAATDAATDRPRDASDGSASNTCNGQAIENLNMLGTQMGETLRYTGSNASASASESSGIQVPDFAQATCNFTTIHQRVFAYTLRASASVRISTTNPGTTPMFDTTLLVLLQRACTTSPRQFLCSDDEVNTTGMTVSTSTLTTAVLPVGTTILIGVGGYDVAEGATTTSTGTFELSVQELAPLAMGAACDTTRRTTGGCNEMTTCVPSTLLGNLGMCRPLGSTPGAACNAGSCDTGLTCDMTRNTCYRVMPNGMGCDRFSDGWERCGDAATCVNLQLGSIRGTCAANGSAAGGTCDMTSMCTAGMNLSCAVGTTTVGTCLNAAPSHGACSTYDSRCPMGQTCVAPIGTIQGTCTDNGTAAGAQCATGACSGAGLTCNTMLTTPICQAAAATGAVCSAYAPCATGQTCYLTDLADRVRGRCFAAGLPSGPCRTTAPFCDSGTTCTNAMPTADNTGRCLREVAVGTACDLFTSRCATGATCVHGAAGTPPNSGTCMMNGSAAGTPCATTGTRCAAGLTCTTMTGAGTCYGPATTDCSPRYNDRHCPMGQSCRATDLDTGTCQTPSMEAATDNDALSAAQTLMTLPASVAGSLTRLDTDCYGFDVPAMGRVFARANYGSGYCVSGQLEIDLYGPMNVYLGSTISSGAFGCPMIDGSYGGMTPLFPYARNLAAGRYTVCVRNPATGRPAVADYVLDVNATAPM